MRKQAIIKTILLLLILTYIQIATVGQTTSYEQFYNEIQFTRAFSEKWASEVNFLSSFSNTPTEAKIFKTNTQRAVNIFAHYHYSSRWKLTSFIGYYRNKDIPDIGQFESLEWRFAAQGTYYIHKIGYTLSTRMRTELRLIENKEGYFDDVYRYRQQLKYLQPLNSKFLRKGVVYILASEELCFRSIVKSNGLSHFDRNLAKIGGGYIFTDDLQVELTYENEFVPRDNGNQLYHAMSLTVTINNFLPKFKKQISDKLNILESDE